MQLRSTLHEDKSTLFPFLIKASYRIHYNAYTAIGSFSAWAASPITNYIVGNFTSYLKDPGQYRLTLTEKAREEKSGGAVDHFGIIGDHVAVWRPRNQAEADAVTNQADHDPLGRRLHWVFKFFSGSESFLLADTRPVAKEHRKLLTRHLVPTRFDAKSVFPEVDRVLQADRSHTIMLRTVMSTMILNLIAKHVLGVNTLPENTYAVMRCFETAVKQTIGLPFPGLFKFIPCLRKKRALLASFEKEVLEGQLNSLLEDLQEKVTPENKNLILTFLIEYIRKDHPTLTKQEFTHFLNTMSKDDIQAYLANDTLRMLPMLLRPADSLSDILAITLEQLVAQPDLMKQLRDEMASVDLFGKEKEMNEDVLMNAMPFLEACYKEALRLDAQAVLPRFAKTGRKLGSFDVPNNTTILIDYEGLHRSAAFGEHTDQFMPSRFFTVSDSDKHGAPQKLTLNQFPFLPFGAGNRLCPFRIVAPRVYRLALIRILSQFELQPAAAQGNEATVTLNPMASHVHRCAFRS